MKKISISLLILGILIMSAPSAQAFTLSDLQIEIQNLKQEVLGMKARLAGQVLGATPITYYIGMTSAVIAKYQQILITNNFLAPTNATGYFGPLTQSAVQAFQKANGLVVTGTLNSQTQSALLSTGAVTSGGGCYTKNDLWQYDNASNTWNQKSNFVTGRESAVAFSIGSKGYLGTGIGNDLVLQKDFWEWDFDTNAWTQKADFGGTARQQAVGFSMGNEGYIGTGYEGPGYSNPTQDFWQWSLATNTWTRKADFGGGTRARAVGFSISDKGYIGTGDQNGVLKKDFWEWNRATDNWVQKADFGGVERIEAVAFPIGFKGYVGTGGAYEVNGSHASIYKDFWEWDQATNAWTQKADFGGGERARAVAYSALGGGSGYIGTGIGQGVGGGLQKDFWEYQPIANTWTQKLDYGGGPTDNAVAFPVRDYGFVGVGTYCGEEPPIACTPNTWNKKQNFAGSSRFYGTGFSIGSKGYIGTGISTLGTLKDFWEYDQVADSWTQKADFGGFPRYRAVGFSVGTKGYIGTGTTDNNFGFNDFWEWDQSTNAWKQKTNVGGTGRLGAVGFSIKDKGYVGTGLNLGSTLLKDFWEYSPVSDSWTQKADFGGGERISAVGFSIENKGYVGTGGSSNFFVNVFRDFWEYDPATNKWIQKANVGGLARKEAAGFSLLGRGYIGTGTGDNGAMLDFWAYYPATNTWVKKANYGGGQNVDAVGFSTPNRGYLSTGFAGVSHWEYCPD